MAKSRKSNNSKAYNYSKKNIHRDSESFMSGAKFFLIFSVAAVLAGVASFQLYLSSLPPIQNLESFKPNIVTKFYSHDGEIIKTFTAYTSSKVDLKDVPQNFINALIATEDKNFYKHNGYDIMGLARSTVQNILAGHVVQGASTLTQQLARMLFLSNEKTIDRKIKELVIASRIEKTISKDKILEMYINNVYLGSGAYGAEGAAQIYFNKHLKDCTLPELALIAGLPQAPSLYSPFNSVDLAVKRRNQVLTRMYKMRFITKDEYNKAKDAKVTLSTMPRLYTTNKAPYFCDYVIKELEKLGFTETEISQGGYKVITTLDYKTQIAANEAVIRNLKSWGMTGKNHQAAVLTYNTIDGRILAYVGGKDYTQSQYDRVTQALRPPGSAFKPFVYAAAIEKGLDPNTMVDDLPVKIGDWSPRNYGNKYRGPIPVYTALMVSSNVAAARIIREIGIRSVIQMARVLGIETPLEYDYTIALGSNAVKLFDFTRAYGAFSNGGYVVEPYAIEKIETARGKVIYRAPKTKISHQLNVRTAAIMTAIMRTVITNGTGMAANIGKPAAGKTGTTDDYKDAYFVGYTPNIVTGVWVGNDDNTKMGSLTGGTVPAIIWRDVMRVATEPFGKLDFSYPKVELKPFHLNPANIKVLDPKAYNEQKEKEEEEKLKQEQEEAENPLPVNVQNMTPADIIRNFKRQNPQMNMPAMQQPVQQTQQPAPAPVQQAPEKPVTPAPTPNPAPIPVGGIN